MKKRWFASVQWTVVVLLVLTGGAVLAQPGIEGKNPPPSAAPEAVAALYFRVFQFMPGR
jgi:hypothetical protein